MTGFIGKTFGQTPLFDVEQGIIIRTPLGEGAGWWAGAPCATFDPISNTFYLVYRLRQPTELGRGVECRIAASQNGITFTDIWAMPKTDLNALSIDRSCLTKGLDGVWRLYMGHVDVHDRRWRISMIEGAEPDELDTTKIYTVLSSEHLDGEGVKNPNVFIVGSAYYLVASYATRVQTLSPEAESQKHTSGDIYSTGLTLSRSGIAISGNGVKFQWLGDISPNQPDRTAAWDSYCRRISAIVPMDMGGFLAFYDGGSSVKENSEERTGLATSFDLRNFYSLTPEAPALVSNHSSGCLRHVDVLPVGHELFYYYEAARPDGSHDLRVAVVERP